MTARKKATAIDEEIAVTRAERRVRERIAEKLDEFCKREDVAPSSAHERLAIGWPLKYQGGRVRAPSKAWVQGLCGNQRARAQGRVLAADQIPKGDMLWALCERLEINAEWLFTGDGAPKRPAARAGGTLATKDLAREFAAHILAACKGAYGSGIELHCDPERLLDTITSAVRDDVNADSKTFDRRARLLAAVNRAEAALGNDLTNPESQSAAQDQIIETLYHLNRVVWETAEPDLRIPIWPATP